MVNVNVIYKSREAALRFVEYCELAYRKQVEDAVSKISDNEKTKIVTLCGPTCSGKTTTASIITALLENKGRRARVLSIDDFYLSHEEMVKRNIKDYEGADALDIELFHSVISDLTQGKKTVLPTFDFKCGKRVSMTEYTPHPSDIYIIEGIQAMYPEVRSAIDDENMKSIFINVSKDIGVCSVKFAKEEIRLIRRIVRDNYFRRTTPEQTLRIWDSVRRNETENILPNAVGADITINSLLPYEIFIMAKIFTDETKDYNINDYNYEIIKSIRQRLNVIISNSVSVDLVPLNSVFREFII